jgi:hypothetical protein
MRARNEEGAIVVEASIALPVYVFLIFTILSIVNICYAQAKVQIALNSAAKQYSEIAYVAYASGIADTGGYSGGKSSATAEKISEEINSFMKEWGITNDTLTEMSEMIGSTSLSSVISNAIATAAMDSLVKREFKQSIDGDSSALVKWLKLDGEPVVHAVMTNNDVLVAGAYYKVKVIKLLNIDYTYNFHSGVITYLWTDANRTSSAIGTEKGD